MHNSVMFFARLFCIGLFVLLLTMFPCMAEGARQDEINGFWLTQDRDGIIEIYSCGSEICGRFHWLKKYTDQEVPRDEENPDTTKRNKPLCHLQFMGGFQPDAQRHYDKGWIYNPEDGQTYSAIMTLKDSNTLDLHGYVIHPLFGQSQTWTRTSSAPACKEIQ